MSDELPFLDRLGEQLQAAGPVRARRPVDALRAAAVIAVVLLSAVVFNAWRSEPVAAGIDVVRDGNRIVLRVSGEAPPASKIQQVAHRYGLDVDVREVPAGPSDVGQLYATSIDSSPAGVRFGPSAIESTDEGFKIVSFPVNWKGHLDLEIARPAASGEEFARPSNALAPGEDLACRHGATPAEISAVAKRHHLVVRWWLTDPDTFATEEDVSYEAVLAAGDQRVAYAYGIAEGLVLVELTPGGRAVPHRPIETFLSC